MDCNRKRSLKDGISQEQAKKTTLLISSANAKFKLAGESPSQSANVTVNSTMKTKLRCVVQLPMYG